MDVTIATQEFPPESVVNQVRDEIMIVDDSRETLQFLTKMLYKNGFDVRPVEEGQGAINAIQNKVPDLILLDISMSGINGYEVCRKLKANPQTELTPVIFISALDDFRNKIKAFEVGAVDYVVKPFNFPEVLARIKTHLQVSRKLRALTETTKLAMHRRDKFLDAQGDEYQSVSSNQHEYAGNEPEDIQDGPFYRTVDSPQSSHEQIEKLENISHDLRNPIHTVKLTFNLLKKRVAPSDPKVQEYFDRIERNLVEISNIITESSGH